MSGFKAVVLSPTHAERWVDILSKHGIEVISHSSPDRLDETMSVMEYPLTIKYGIKEIMALKYFKTTTNEVGVVFLSNDRDDIECINFVISLLREEGAGH